MLFVALFFVMPVTSAKHLQTQANGLMELKTGFAPPITNAKFGAYIIYIFIKKHHFVTQFGLVQLMKLVIRFQNVEI